MLTVLLAATLAHADGLHAGVPVTGIAGFGPPSFQTEQTGWSAIVLDGFVRVYVGKTEEEAAAWVVGMKKRLRREKPKPNPSAFSAPGITDVHGNGTRLILFRDGNIGICVQHKTNARPWATKAHNAIVDEGPPLPQAPQLSEAAGLWTLQAGPQVVQIDFEGGRLARGTGYRFSVPPTAWTAWDALGRPVRTEAPTLPQSTAVAE